MLHDLSSGGNSWRERIPLSCQPGDLFRIQCKVDQPAAARHPQTHRDREHGPQLLELQPVRLRPGPEEGSHRIRAVADLVRVMEEVAEQPRPLQDWCSQ